MYQFKIYTESKKFHPSRNQVIYSIAFICILPTVISVYILKSKNIPNFEEYCFYFALILLGIGQVLRWINYKSYEPLNGDLDCSLTLEMEKISINQTEYELSKIKNVEFNCWDYKGLTSFYSPLTGANLNNALSNGIKNTVKITMNDNSFYSYNFQQSYEGEIRNAEAELINYYILGKLHFLNLIDTLGIREYEDIQKFKETLPPTAVSSHLLV